MNDAPQHAPADPHHSKSQESQVDPAQLTRWQKFRLVVKVIELRLRFIALMAGTGLIFGYWDTIWNYYEKYTRPPGVSVPGHSDTEYYCPMHPTVIQPEPGSCPICGMPLSKRKKGEPEKLPDGVLSRLVISPTRVTQAGVKTAEIAYLPLTEKVTTVGTVSFDERRLARISSKTRGMSRVEKLYVNFTGVAVKAGEPLAEIFSPDLEIAIRELLLGQESARNNNLSAAGKSLFGNDGKDLVALAREKLARWGITADQVDEILAKGRSSYRVPILSPISGIVVRKNIVEGQYVAEGESLFEIADLSHVWIQAQVYEDQIALVQVGQQVEASVDAYPGEIFKGTVAFKDPVLNPATRTLGVRYDLDNKSMKLQPGMFATVTLFSPVANAPAFRSRTAQAPMHNDSTHKISLSVAQQKICPVTTLKLGAMGAPVSVDLDGKKVWTCCEACPSKLKATPAKYLVRLEPPPKDSVLAVPESAVIDTGMKKIVFVETEPGIFEGREIVVGPMTGSMYPVLEGLSPGEKVAAAGAFLLDAETRLKGTSGVHNHQPDEMKSDGDHDHQPDEMKSKSSEMKIQSPDSKKSEPQVRQIQVIPNNGHSH